MRGEVQVIGVIVQVMRRGGTKTREMHLEQERGKPVPKMMMAVVNNPATRRIPQRQNRLYPEAPGDSCLDRMKECIMLCVGVYHV